MNRSAISPERDAGSAAAPALAWTGVSRVLRWLGAGMLVASLSVFLFQSWERGDDVHRYLLLLGHTSGLALVGVACGTLLRESRGARTFLSLALLSVPVHLLILGGLIYSTGAWDGAVPGGPAFAVWEAPSRAVALATTGGALMLLAPITWLGFAALARPHALRLTLALLGAAALLLVPLRAPDVVSLTAALAALACGWHDWTQLREQPLLRTPEGAFARALLISPPLFALGRAAALYEPTALLGAAASGTAGLLLLGLARSDGAARELRLVAEIGATACAAGASFFAALGLVSPELFLPVHATLFAAGLIGLSIGSVARPDAYRAIAAAVALLGHGLQLARVADAPAAFLALLAGACVLAWGVARREPFWIGAGGLLCVGGVGVAARLALIAWAPSVWTGLAVAGVAAVLGGSLVERRLRPGVRAAGAGDGAD